MYFLGEKNPCIPSDTPAPDVGDELAVAGGNLAAAFPSRTPWVTITKNAPRYCQMSLGAKIAPGGETLLQRLDKEGGRGREIGGVAGK